MGQPGTNKPDNCTQAQILLYHRGMKIIIVHTLDGSEVVVLGPEHASYHLEAEQLARKAFYACEQAQGVVTVTHVGDGEKTVEEFDLIEF